MLEQIAIVLDLNECKSIIYFKINAFVYRRSKQINIGVHAFTKLESLKYLCVIVNEKTLEVWKFHNVHRQVVGCTGGFKHVPNIRIPAQNGSLGWW